MGWQDGTPVETAGTQPAWMQGEPVAVQSRPPIKNIDNMQPMETGAEALAGNAVTRFALGAASPILGGAQLLANVSPVMRMGGLHTSINDHLKQLEEMKNAGMAGGGREGMDWIGLGGSVANPAGIVAAKALPAMATLGGRVAQGAGFGAGMGATAPVTSGDFTETKALQTGAGAALGGIIPLAISALKGVGGTISDVSDLFTKGGAERVFLKYQNRIMGADESTRQAVVNALRTAEEYVKGGKPTAAEALSTVPQASPLVEYQRILAATPGGPSGQFGKRIADQEAARMAALQTVGKTPEALQTAVTERARAAGDNYGPIMGRMVSPKSDTQIMEEAIAGREASRIAALQDQGRFQTAAAQQANLSAGGRVNLSPNQTPNQPQMNVGATGGTSVSPQAYPVPGQPRFPARYTENAERVPEAERAASEAGFIAKMRQDEAGFLKQTLENLRNTVGMSDTPLTKYLNRPSMQAAIKDAAESARETGSYFPANAGEPFSVRNLQRIKESLDSGILAASNAARAGKRPELSEAELTGTRQAFVKWLSNKVPEWRDARLQFASDSKEIDRMKVGQGLMDKLVSATGNETPGSFAAAVRNEMSTIKKATGQQRYPEGIKGLMTTEENATIDSVLKDVTRRARAFNQPQGTNLYGGVNVAEETVPRLPNLLSRPAMIVNALMRSRSNKLEQEIDKLGADAYLNPSKLADLLEKMPSARRNRLLTLLEDSRNTAVGASPVYALQGQQ